MIHNLLKKIYLLFEKNTNNDTYRYLKLPKIKFICMFFYILMCRSPQSNIGTIVSAVNSSNVVIRQGTDTEMERIKYPNEFLPLKKRPLRNLSVSDSHNSSPQGKKRKIETIQNQQETDNKRSSILDSQYSQDNSLQENEDIPNSTQSQNTKPYFTPDIESLLNNIKDLSKNIVENYKNCNKIELVTKNISLNYQENKSLNKKDQIDKTIFLKSFYHKFLIDAKQKYALFSVNSRFYGLGFRLIKEDINNIKHFNKDDKSKDPYKSFLIDFFALFLANRSKIFNTKLIVEISKNKNEASNIIQSNIPIFFDSLTNENDFLNLKFIDHFNEDKRFKKLVFALYTDFALLNNTADREYLNVIEKDLIIDSYINSNLNYFKNIKYSNMIATLNKNKPDDQKNPEEELYSQKENENTSDGQNNPESDNIAKFLLNCKTFASFFRNNNIKKVIFTKFKNYLENKKENQNTTIPQDEQEMVSEDNNESNIFFPKSSNYQSKMYKLEWFPKMYEFVSDQRCIEILNQYCNYSESLIENYPSLQNKLDSYFKTVNKNIRELIKSLSTNMNQAESIQIDKDKLKNIIEKKDKNISKKISKNMKELNEIYGKNFEIYHSFCLFQKITFSIIKIMKSIAIIYLIPEENLNNFTSCSKIIFNNSYVPEMMILAYVDPISFINSFKTAANE